MPIRNNHNLRERRRERIEQLTDQYASGKINEAELTFEDQLPSPQPKSSSTIGLPITNEPDPELWWKEREKRLKSGQGQAADWHGIKRLSPTSSPRLISSGPDRVRNAFVRGLSLRCAIAAIALAATWGWFKYELPGSGSARDWMVDSVTHDMNFEAVEAWYGHTFGGSPSFLSFAQDGPDTKEVTARLNPGDTTVPVRGKVVQSFAENGAGIKFAAASGSKVFAIYTGRVQQVTQNQDGGITVIVQHQNHILSVYGGLEQASVKPNDWVETGQQVGQLKPSRDSDAEGVLYFAVQQQGTALDPADVVSID